ncbi:DUF3737 family protein [Streptomyces sp. NPDC059861]|uniref:DUF3737 family protein n=1 Tax=Streptomyces sp. NPDC059861 TaxID=3346974 RepID=UPI003660AF15
MQEIENQYFTGERALFQGRDLNISYTTFADGESPLKESRGVTLDHSLFKWKYPLWYSQNVTMTHSALLETARSGVWYTHNLTVSHSTIEAPKTFRRARNITLDHVDMPVAQETLWDCDTVRMSHVTAKGDYFGMNSRNISAIDFRLSGNYAFDGARNIEIHNATMLSKDAFWNCEDVTVHDSFIVGEYLGWNSKNLTFVNCTIESLQGLCYIENLTLKNCRLMNTTLAFEYSTVDADVTTEIESVLNPSGGTIRAKGIGELIMDDTKVDPRNTTIVLTEQAYAA